MLASQRATSVAMPVGDMEQALEPATARATAVTRQEAAMGAMVAAEKHTKRPELNVMALKAAPADPVPPMVVATRTAKRAAPMVAALAVEEGHTSVLHLLVFG